jgi:early secretory antigenic target protein ESAT-6
MSGSQKVDFESLSALATSLEQYSANIQHILATLDYQSNQLRAGWTGAAAEAYDTAKASWTADLAALNTMLASTARFVDSATQRYASLESGLAKQI